MGTYIAMIYGDEKVWEAWTEEEGLANAAGHGRFNAAHGGAVTGGHQLDRSWKARSVRSDGQSGTVVTNGPFLGGATVLGGYYLIESSDLDDAVRIARDLPEASAPGSGIEVRPVVAP